MSKWSIALGFAALMAGPLNAASDGAPALDFAFKPDTPRHLTVLVEFRDPGEKGWPHYFAGKPVTPGRLVLDPRAPVLEGSVRGNSTPQTGGSQERRVLGELFTVDGEGKPVPPVVEVDYRSIGSVEHPAKGKDKDKPDPRRARAEASGVLRVNGREVPWTGTMNLRLDGNPASPSEVQMETVAEVDAAALGLQQVRGRLEVRIFTMAYAPGAKPLKK